MFINKIKIDGFRNIGDEIFFPSKKVNILFGENANGKTSYIEAIYSVSNLKSFRTSNLNETINNLRNISTINCEYILNECNNTLNLKINKNGRSYLKNDKETKVENYLWSLFTIIFKPEDILLIGGSPSKRRELIDKAIFFIDKDFIKTLKKYYKIVSNKNICLKTNNLKNIEEWNILIAKYSSLIVLKRNKYIERINKIFEDNIFKFKYFYKIENDINISKNELENYFLKEIVKNTNKELKYSYSIVGAHKQNIDFSINNKDLKKFGSQGQKRTFILLFKSSQIIDFQNTHSFSPVLLLDDMASELDDNNKNIFYEIIEKFSGQTFITTTDKKLFSDFKNVSRFFVEDGKISSFS